MTTQSHSAALRQPRNWMTNLYRMLHLDYHQPPWMRGVADLHRGHPDWFVRAEDGSFPAGAWLQHPASHICASSPYLVE